MEYKIVHIEETDSTNRWLKAHGEGKMVVVADYQTAGKGCGTNSWESERGKNLTFSMLIHPTTIPACQQFRITEVISVAICEVLEQYIGDVSIKWPNDIYVGDKKICGILIENMLKGEYIRHCIIGIGLNINQKRFVSDAPNPTSMALESGHDFDREEVLQSLLRHFEQLLAVWDEEAIRKAYRQRLYRKEGMFPYRDKEGDFTASLVDVEDDGHLVLQDAQGQQRRYAFKEVTFVIEKT